MTDAPSTAATGPDRSTDTDEPRLERLGALARTGVLLVVTVTWIAFWTMVARIHLLQGDLPSAGFVAVVFVTPGVGLLGWTLGLVPDDGRPVLPDRVAAVTD